MNIMRDVVSIVEVEYRQSSNILEDAKYIVETSQKVAYQAVNVTLVRRNWLLGKRIAEEELNNATRAEYGMEIIKKLSKELNANYGKGFDRSNLYHFYRFYKTFPNIFDTVCRQSQQLLTWSHYRSFNRRVLKSF